MRCLALVFGKTLGASSIELAPGDPVAFDGVNFSREAENRTAMFSGFHDWLRKRKEGGGTSTVGVRIWPHDMSGWREALGDKNYIQLLEDAPGFIVWFGDRAAFDNDLSGDQSFAVNMLFPNDLGTTGAVLDMSGLGPNDEVPVAYR